MTSKFEVSVEILVAPTGPVWYSYLHIMKQTVQFLSGTFFLTFLIWTNTISDFQIPA